MPTHTQGADILLRLYEIENQIRDIEGDYRGLDLRVKGLEGSMGEVKLSLAHHSAELRASTNLVEEIHGVASEVGAFVKNPKLLSDMSELVALKNDVQTVWKTCKRIRTVGIEIGKWAVVLCTLLGAIAAAVTAPTWTQAIVRFGKALVL